MKATNKWKVIKLKGSDRNEVEDTVAEEKRLRISINGREVLSLYCTPLMVRELAVGIIMTEGIAESICFFSKQLHCGKAIVRPRNARFTVEGRTLVFQGVNIVNDFAIEFIQDIAFPSPMRIQCS